MAVLQALSQADVSLNSPRTPQADDGEGQSTEPNGRILAQACMTVNCRQLTLCARSRGRRVETAGPLGQADRPESCDALLLITYERIC